MKMVKHKVDQSICVYGAGILLKHCQALAQEIEGVRSGSEDIEFIHRMRVATRRLRSAFPLFEMCLPPKKGPLWLAQIKKVTRSLGAARDTDVQLDALRQLYANLSDKQYRPGLTRLMLRLSQKRRRLQAPLTHAMQAFQDSLVLEDMVKRLTPLADRQAAIYLYTPALYEHSYNAIHEHLNELLAFDDIVFQPEKKEELHAMRISAKWLRYTLENLAPIYNNSLKPHLLTVRKVQEMLGDIHDYDMWIDFLPVFLQEERQRTLDFFGSERSFHRVIPGMLYFGEDRQTLRDERYQQFTAAWQGWQEEAVWDNLREIIRLPFHRTLNPPAETVEV